MTWSRYVLGAVFGMLAVGTAQADQGAKFSVISVPSYSTGNYGSSTETVSMYSLPVTVKVKKGAFSAKASMSYLIVSTSGTSTTPKSSGFGAKTGGAKGSGSTNNSIMGLGDTWLEARYGVTEGDGALPDITPYLKLKLATAASGLGSGYQDYEGGAALEWIWGESVYPFVDAGVRNVADASGARTNISTFDAGISYGLTRTTSLTAMIARDQSVRVSTADPLYVSFSWSHFYEPTSGVQAYFDKGLSSGSPDFAIGVGFERKF